MQKNTLKILVVDDEPMVQIAHTSMLKSLNCIVEIASDGQQAIDMWKNGFDAGSSGQSVNPYPHLSRDAWAWSSGYIEGQAAAERARLLMAQVVGGDYAKSAR